MNPLPKLVNVILPNLVISILPSSTISIGKATVTLPPSMLPQALEALLRQ